MPIEIKAPKTLVGFIAWGALLDLLLFLSSFLVFGGAHGPAGPMFLLETLHAPLGRVAARLWPMEKSNDLQDLGIVFLVVLISGAGYGFLVGVAVNVWRVVRRFVPGRR